MLKPVVEIQTSDSEDKSCYIAAAALLVLSATNSDRSSRPGDNGKYSSHKSQTSQNRKARMI